MPDPTESLVQLGLTQLEADIYRFLLGDSPATGHRIARGLGKPNANVYKALDSLHAKSALLVQEGDPRRFTPVPVDELLDRLQRDFAHHVESTRAALRELPGPADDDGIYHIRGREAVLERCRAMFSRAHALLLVDAFPIPLRELADDISACCARDIRTAVKCYETTGIDGAEVVLDPDHERTRQRWPVQWLNVVVDAEEVLVAAFDESGEEVLEAVWTRNPWIAFALEGTLGNEIAFTRVRAAHPRFEEMDRAVHDGESLLLHETPGRQRLRKLLGLNPKLENES